MTREEAIEVLLKKSYCFHGREGKEAKALTMAIVALHQQRQEILPKHCIVPSGDCVATAGMPKHGKWILGKEVSREYIGDVCVGIEYDGWHCSSCKIKIEEPYKPSWNYCPNCGARME